MENKAVSNTGPIIHLTEISLTNVFEVFSYVITSQNVFDELTKYRISLPKKVKIKEIDGQTKDQIKILTNNYNLDIGEASAIALALQEKLNLFITDDLDARYVARNYYLEVHGTIGVILRAFREKIIDKKTAMNKIGELYHSSSLFVTKNLIDDVLKAIDNFK